MDMNRRTRTGFTLVELLVVITIIGMLVGLLLPAVGAIRDAARLTQCKNNHHQLYLAAAGYEASREKFPSYFFKYRVEGEDTTASWVVSLLPYIGEKPLYERWVEKGEKRPAYLKFMVCPSNPPETTEGSPANYKANLLVMRERRPYSAEQVNSSDGAQHTILFSEDVKSNTEHNRWNLDEPDPIKQQLCFTTEIIDYDEDGSSGSNDDDEGTPIELYLGSKHSAGIVVVTCAGDARTISDDISNRVYQALVTPDSGEQIDEDSLR